MPATPEELARLEADVAEQGAVVRTLKKDKATSKDVMETAVTELKRRKQILEDAKPKPWDRAPFEDLMRRRFVYAPAFELYGGCAGLYDYGPVGCAIKANFINAWREHFVLKDSMLEVDCPSMTPYRVLEASGHVERFTDIMVKDTKTDEFFRADHLLKDVMKVKMVDSKLSAEEREEARLYHDQADTYSKDDLKAIFEKNGIKAPNTGNELSDPKDFNMMFASQIGPSGNIPAFLRPETAQGIFLAFKRLYDYNNKRLPFAGAQIGMAFRNEISPRNGMLRVREFQMAEIEHFCDPLDKSYPKFASVADLVLPLLAADDQVSGKPITRRRLGDAVADGTINNETLGYFIGRIYQFLTAIGADESRLRFRQHMKNEMAHYACDCWDAEMLTSYGWVECVGCADRSAFDLQAHGKATNQVIEAAVALPEPVEQNVVLVVPNKKKMGPKFGKTAGTLMQYLEKLDEAGAASIEAALGGGGDGVAKITVDGIEYQLDSSLVSVERKIIRVHERKFVPAVIEPSFGIGRCIFCVLEQVYKVRDGDEQRGYLSLPPLIAPVKCSLLPIGANPDFGPVIASLQSEMTVRAVSCKVDDSGVSIGKRYARTDEIGIPFGVTVDFTSLADKTATIRERDSMLQIRVPISAIPDIVARLSTGLIKWADCVAEHGLVKPPADE